MNFAQRIKETLQTGLDIGFKAGVQKGCDLWMAALAQEGFGAERMIRMYERVEYVLPQKCGYCGAQMEGVETK